MVLAKPLSSKPRDVASKLVEGLESRLSALCEAPEIAGPGFINLRLKDEFVAAKLKSMVGDRERLGITRYAPCRTCDETAHSLRRMSKS